MKSPDPAIERTSRKAASRTLARRARRTLSLTQPTARVHGARMKITVSRIVVAPIQEVWRAYTTPEDVKLWNAASPDWHTTVATVDLRPGGKFCSRMEAKDGSFGFDFEGVYTNVVPHQRIEYAFGD